METLKCDLCGRKLELVEIDPAEKILWVACPVFYAGEAEDADEHSSYPIEVEDVNIVGVSEVAEMLGWPKGKVSEYLRRGKLLEPAYRLKSGPIWFESQIREFQKNFSA